MTRLIELTVACPDCGARPMYPCHSRRRRTLERNQVHRGRLRLLGLTDDEIDEDRRRAR